jgi:hypothetical protein
MNLYGLLSDEKAMAGMLYGLNPKTIVSIPAGENINFGKGVFLNADKTAVVGGKYNNNAVIDLSAYTTASKDITLTIKGVDIEATTTGTIATDVAAIVEDINDDVEGVTAVAGTGADAGKITITSDDSADLGVKLVYDGSDVTSSKVTASSDCVYAGVSVFHQNAFLTVRGLYVKTEAVNVMEHGYIYVALASGVNPTVGATAYVTAAGTFTTESSGNTQVGVFKSAKETGSNNDSIALVSLS